MNSYTFSSENQFNNHCCVVRKNNNYNYEGLDMPHNMVEYFIDCDAYSDFEENEI
jgi:hypothetical protein